MLLVEAEGLVRTFYNQCHLYSIEKHPIKYKLLKFRSVMDLQLSIKHKYGKGIKQFKNI